MADALYMEDSYLREWDAKVVSTKGKYVVLDSTAFFPRGGGVEFDTGTIGRNADEFRVVFTGKFDGDISHEVDREGLAAGDSVRCALDWERRYLLMRHHTAAHVLSGIFHNEFGLKITGNNLTPEKGRIDFDMETMDMPLIERGFARAAELVGQNLPVRVYSLSREEAMAKKELFKLAIGFPHDIPVLRIVEIVGFDAQADGGCHVRSLAEIGKIVLAGTDNKGKSNRRVLFRLE